MKPTALKITYALILLMMIGCQGRERRAFETAPQQPNPTDPGNTTIDDKPYPNELGGGDPSEVKPVVDKKPDDKKPDDKKPDVDGINNGGDQDTDLTIGVTFDDGDTDSGGGDDTTGDTDPNSGDSDSIEWDGKSHKGNSTWTLSPL